MITRGFEGEVREVAKSDAKVEAKDSDEDGSESADKEDTEAAAKDDAESSDKEGAEENSETAASDHGKVLGDSIKTLTCKGCHLGDENSDSPAVQLSGRPKSTLFVKH